MVRHHSIGLLLATEEDWPSAFNSLLARVGPVRYSGETHEFSTGRITNEPFDLRSRPRYALVIDRLSWWYDLPREWLKKIALMDEVYLLKNPFTFQAMEKHAAYCAMMRLGLKVPDTWLIPHLLPPDNPRYVPMAERYNPPFDLDEVAKVVGYPHYMKPFDGGQWIGVTRIANSDELHASYEASGERLMHIQAAVEDFDVFTRSLSIGPQTLLMRFDPSAHGHYRYVVDRDFLAPELEWEVETISRLVNAFFGWEFNAVRDDRQGRPGAPDRLRERLPRHRARQPSLLLPVGDRGARRLVHLLHGHRPCDADQPEHRATTSRSRTATTSGTTRSSRATGSSRTPTCRRRSSKSSAPQSCHTCES
jgi:hypothetical protein